MSEQAPLRHQVLGPFSWTSSMPPDVSEAPFALHVLDEGAVASKDCDGRVVWQQWVCSQPETGWRSDWREVQACCDWRG